MSNKSTIRIPFRWLFIATIIFFLIGIFGGFLGQQLWQTPMPLTLGDGQRIIAPIQEVTISPNTAVEQVVREANRSVMALVSASDTTTPIANGFVITNDGLIVTTSDIASQPLTAIDEIGQLLPLNEVGTDELFGLSYYRLPNTVVVPLDTSQVDPLTGQVHLLLGRAAGTFTAQVEPFSVTAPILPGSFAPAAWQQLLLGTGVQHSLPGAPLLDEAGRVSGILVSGANGQVLPISQLQESIDRVLGERREANPFTDYGFTVNWQFTRVDEGGPLVFGAAVANVTRTGSAAQAGLARGDVIIGINDQPLEWANSFVTALSDPDPTITVRRDSEELRLPL